MKISTEELEAIPEVELMLDIVFMPEDGGAPATVHARSDLDDVLSGEQEPPEVWDDGSELEEFISEEGSSRRWMPRVLVVAGALALVAGALVVTVGQSSEAADRVTGTPDGLEPILPTAHTQEPDPAAPEELEGTSDEAGVPAARNKRRRARARTGARSKVDLRRQVLEAMGVDGEAASSAPVVEEESPEEPPEPPAPRVVRTKNVNTPMFLASRIYRRNKRSLLACDRLAQRRGENLANSRAMFDIEVDGQGTRSVKVTGTGVPDRRMSCYRVMANRWRLPRTEAGYRTSFKHVK